MSKRGLPRAFVDVVLVASEEVHQERATSSPLQHFGDEAVPWTEAATPAAVREEYDPNCLRRQRQRALELNTSRRNVDRPRIYRRIVLHSVRPA